MQSLFESVDAYSVVGHCPCQAVFAERLWEDALLSQQLCGVAWLSDVTFEFDDYDVLQLLCWLVVE